METRRCGKGTPDSYRQHPDSCLTKIHGSTALPNFVLMPTIFGTSRWPRSARAGSIRRRVVETGNPDCPGGPMLRDALYSVYEKMGRPRTRCQTLQQAVSDCPDDPNLRVQLSRLLCSLHRPDAAVASIQSAVQRWPANAELHAALGYALSNARKNEQAVAELREAMRLDFSLVEVHYNLAVGLFALGQRDAARATVQTALGNAAGLHRCNGFLGTLALEDSESCRSRANDKSAPCPSAGRSRVPVTFLRPPAVERYGSGAEREVCRSGEFYRSGLAVDPKYWRLSRAEGLLDIRQGHFPDAVESLRGYVQAQPERTESYFMLGVALQKAGQVDEGRKVLQQGLSLEQQNGDNADKVEAFKHALEQP